MPSPNATNPVDRRDSSLSSPATNQLRRAATSYLTGSSSSGSSTHNASSTQSPSKRPKYRLVLWLPGPPQRYLTINRESISARFGSPTSIPRKIIANFWLAKTSHKRTEQVSMGTGCSQAVIPTLDRQIHPQGEISNGKLLHR
jgi:hypothetical protein